MACICDIHQDIKYNDKSLSSRQQYSVFNYLLHRVLLYLWYGTTSQLHHKYVTQLDNAHCLSKQTGQR